MFKKFISSFMVFVLVLCGIIGFSGCNITIQQGAPEQPGLSVEKAYVQAQDLGYKGSFDDFKYHVNDVLKDESSKDVHILFVKLNDDGNVEVAFNNDKSVIFIIKDNKKHDFTDWEIDYSKDIEDCNKTPFIRRCKICGKVETKIVNVDHSWTNVFSFDENYHWHNCEYCLMHSEKEAHVFNNNNECVICGYKKYVEPEEFLTREQAEQQGYLSGTLVIKTMDRGYGVKGIDQIARDYCKNVNPNADIEVIHCGDIEMQVQNELSMGAIGETDLFFANAVNYPFYNLPCQAIYNGQSSLFDFNKFIETWNVYGTNEKLKSRLRPEIINALTYEKPNEGAKNYVLPWAGGGSNGLCYNYKIFEEAGVPVPETTDELLYSIELFDKYNKIHQNDIGFKPIVPIIYPGQNAIVYWSYLSYVWWAQYQGYENFLKYWTLAENNPQMPNSKFLTQEGQLEALKVIEKLIKGNHVYPHSLETNHTIGAHLFVKGNGEQRFAMMPTGDWFENETASIFGMDNLPNDFKMMKTPKLSSAVLKYGGEENVPDYGFSVGTQHTLVMPNWSKEKYLALDFLSYYYSDQGIKTFAEQSKSLLPVNDFSCLDGNYNLGSFVNSQLEIANNKNIKYTYESEMQSPLRSLGGLRIFPTCALEMPEIMMLNGKTALETYNTYNNYFLSNWDRYLHDSRIQC